MRFNPIRAFRDPATRPRVIIWAGVGLIALILLMVFGLVGTCYEWFCTTPCHMVHDDNTLAYRASTHTNVSCVACHEPVNADPVTFTLLKIEVVPDLYATVTNTFEVPLNADSHYALELGDDQCTQCHDLSNRVVSPSSGLIIDHAVHTKNDVTCVSCHNRVAHPEDDIELILGDRKHDDWLTMDACFRCHSLGSDAKAPGACAKCHPKNFALVPESHDATAGWYTRFGTSTGHAKAAREESASIAEAAKYFAEFEPVDPAHAEGPVLKPSSTVNSCFTCHKTSFCNDCHQLPMPHPADFTKNHGTAGYRNPSACANCHARNAAEARGTGFCNACHHPRSTPGTPWRRQHPQAVIKDGAKSCFACHDSLYCETCHVSGPQAAQRYARARR